MYRAVITVGCSSVRSARSSCHTPALIASPSHSLNSRALPLLTPLNPRNLSISAATHPQAQEAHDQLCHPDVCHRNVNGFTPDVFSFFEEATATWQYILVDRQTLEAAIIDPVLDYDPASGEISTQTADRLLAFVRQRGLSITHILETHAHADHLTASRYLKSRLPNDVLVGIGKRITQVQKTFAPIYGFDDPVVLSRAFDVYFEDDEQFKLGNHTCRVMYLPGHTPDHVGYLFGSAVFTGDSIFNPDVGSARADFPGGNAKALYASMQRLLSLPRDSLLFVGHDYPPSSARKAMTSATVEDHRAAWQRTNERQFVAWREKRDATLGAPKLLHPALQVNIRGGRLPPKDKDGRMWFKTPVRAQPDLEW